MSCRGSTTTRSVPAAYRPVERDGSNSPSARARRSPRPRPRPRHPPAARPAYSARPRAPVGDLHLVDSRPLHLAGLDVDRGNAQVRHAAVLAAAVRPARAVRIGSPSHRSSGSARRRGRPRPGATREPVLVAEGASRRARLAPDAEPLGRTRSNWPSPDLLEQPDPKPHARRSGHGAHAGRVRRPRRRAAPRHGAHGEHADAGRGVRMRSRRRGATRTARTASRLANRTCIRLMEPARSAGCGASGASWRRGAGSARRGHRCRPASGAPCRTGGSSSRSRRGAPAWSSAS